MQLTAFDGDVKVTTANASRPPPSSPAIAHMQLVRLLLKHKASLDLMAEDVYGRTALFHAAGCAQGLMSSGG